MLKYKGLLDMERNKYFIINYYDKQVFKRMIEKYAMEPMEATR